MRINLVVFSLLILISWNCTTKQESVTNKFEEPVAALYDKAHKPFYHGVASGDPLSDRVIIWTRVTPETADSSDSSIRVTWEIALDSLFTSLVTSDTLVTSSTRDYTVKVDVGGLEPDRYYYYRFKALNATSITGRTKTISSGAKDSLQFAVVSCSNWEFGFFNAYDCIAKKEVDAVLHLGDFIYEYGVATYSDTSIGRTHLPPHELVTLTDYRTRYSQYRLDDGSRHVTQRHPFITIWDDHEVANDVYKEGALNHQPEEGEFEKRKAAAKQAYYEWQPIREGSKHYRSFSMGNLVDLIMLDERLEGRTKPVDSITSPNYMGKDRSMLGKEQLAWFEDKLKNSKATWKLIGNQTVFSDLDQSATRPLKPRNLDSWDGYPVEKKQIISFIKENSIRNIVFLTGDTHASWGFEVASDPFKNYKTNKNAFAIELATPSISSANWNEYASDDTVKNEEANFLKLNPHLKYLNARDHGYILLTVYPDKTKAEWFYVNTLRKVSSKENVGKKLVIKKDMNSLQ